VNFFLTTGHGEHVDLRDTTPSGFSDFARLIERLGFKIIHVADPVGSNIPSLTLLTIIDPDSKFSESEREEIFRFVHKGGSLLVMGNERGKSNVHTVNSILVPLFGVKFNPDQVSDQNKKNQYRDRYEVKAKINSEDFKELLKNSFFEVIDNTNRLIATISTRRLNRNRSENSGADKGYDETQKVTTEMKKLLGREFEIVPLPPVCPYPDVVETTIEKNTSLTNLFADVQEISYAFGCSLSIEKKMGDISVVARSSRNCEPSNAPLIMMGDVGQGKVAIIGSKDMFSNDASFGLYVSHNSTLIESIINWLSTDISKTSANLIEDAEASTDTLSNDIRSVEGEEELPIISTIKDNRVFKKIEDSLLNDAIIHQEIEKLVECLTQMSLLRISIRDDEATIADKGFVELNAELISRKRRDILISGDKLQNKTNEQKFIVNRIMRRFQGIYDISDLDFLSKKLISANQNFPKSRETFDISSTLTTAIDFSEMRESEKGEENNKEDRSKLKEPKESSPHIQEIVAKFQREITDLEIVIKTEKDTLRDLELNPTTASEKEKCRLKLYRHQDELDKMTVQADVLIKMIKTSG